MPTAAERRKALFTEEAGVLAQGVRDRTGDSAARIAAAMMRVYRRGLDDVGAPGASVRPEEPLRVRWQDLAPAALDALLQLAGDRGREPLYLAETGKGFEWADRSGKEYFTHGRPGQYRCDRAAAERLLDLGLAEWRDVHAPFGRLVFVSAPGAAVADRWGADTGSRTRRLPKPEARARLPVDAERLRADFRNMARDIVSDEREKRKLGISTNLRGRIVTAMNHAYACGTGAREPLPPRASLGPGWEDYDPEIVGSLPREMSQIFLDLCEEAYLDPRSRFGKGGEVRVAIGSRTPILLSPRKDPFGAPAWAARVVDDGDRTGGSIRRDIGNRAIEGLIARGLLQTVGHDTRRAATVSVEGMRAYMAHVVHRAVGAGAGCSIDWGHLATKPETPEPGQDEAAGPPAPRR